MKVNKFKGNYESIIKKRRITNLKRFFFFGKSVHNVLKIERVSVTYVMNTQTGAPSNVKSEHKADFLISSKVIVSVPSL